MTQWQIGILCTISGIFISLFFSVLTYKRNVKKDSENTGEGRGVLQSDIGYIKAGIDDLKRENRAVNLKLDSISERVTRVEERCKQAHKIIDEIKETEHI